MTLVSLVFVLNIFLTSVSESIAFKSKYKRKTGELYLGLYERLFDRPRADRFRERDLDLESLLLLKDRERFRTLE